MRCHNCPALPGRFHESATQPALTSYLEDRLGGARQLLLAWPEAGCSVSGYSSVSLVSAWFWHVTGTVRSSLLADYSSPGRCRFPRLPCTQVLGSRGSRHMAVMIGSPDGTRAWVPHLSLGDLLRDAPRGQELPRVFEQALNGALDEAEILLDTYRGSQSLNGSELEILVYILKVLPPFKAVVRSDQTKRRIQGLLDKAEPALIVAMIRELDRWAVTEQQLPAKVPDATGKLTQQQVLLVVVIWLAAIWLPVIAIGLPPKDHAAFTDWVGTVSLAITLVSIVIKKGSRD